MSSKFSVKIKIIFQRICMVVIMILWTITSYLWHLWWLIVLSSNLYVLLCVIKHHIMSDGCDMPAEDAYSLSTWSHLLLRVHTFACLGQILSLSHGLYDICSLDFKVSSFLYNICQCPNKKFIGQRLWLLGFGLI